MHHIRITASLERRIRDDLKRPHAFAGERVGYVVCRSDGALILATEYLEIRDEEYEHSLAVGAQISGAAIKRMLSEAYVRRAGLFHVHEHPWTGRPEFSGVDLASLKGLVPAFFGMSAGPHGALLFSEDEVGGLVWTSGRAAPVAVSRVTRVGFPMRNWSATNDHS